MSGNNYLDALTYSGTFGFISIRQLYHGNYFWKMGPSNTALVIVSSVQHQHGDRGYASVILLQSVSTPYSSPIWSTGHEGTVLES